MRTNIDIDDKLLAEIMELTGARTKKEAIDNALRTQLRFLKSAKAIRAAYGKLKWEGDLDAMRRAE